MLEVLGKNSDDRGAQLEKLTRRLLSSLGYKDVVLNEIGAGGDELDLAATQVTRIPASQIETNLICECKAYRRPVDMPDWLKFLGKIYSQEALLGNVAGLFIALSGANGNVMGHFKNLQERKQRIDLLQGSSLVESVQREWPGIDIADVWAIGKRLTPRKIENVALAYYEEDCFWLLLVGTDAYAILDRQGRFLGTNVRPDLQAAVSHTLKRSTLIDLAREAGIRAMSDHVKKVGLQLAMAGTTDTEAALKAQVPAAVALPEIIFRNAVDDLLKTTWIADENGAWKWKVPELGVEQKIAFLSFIFSGRALLDFVGLPEIDRVVEKDLAAMIASSQKGLALSESDFKFALTLARASPRALLRAITPNQMITIHRETQAFMRGGQIDAFDGNTLLTAMVGAFREDFNEQAFGAYFAEKRNIREVAIETTISLRADPDDAAPLFERHVYEKHALMRAAPEHGGGWVLILKTADAPIFPDKPDAPTAEAQAADVGASSAAGPSEHDLAGTDSPSNVSASAAAPGAVEDPEEDIK